MSSKAPMLEYLEPINPEKFNAHVVPAVKALQGKTIAFLDNGWSSFARIGVRLEQALRQRFGIAEMRTYSISASSSVSPALLDKILAECDAAVVGMAN